MLESVTAVGQIESRGRSARLGRVGVLLDLIKARLTVLVVMTTAVGFVTASGDVFSVVRLALCLLGTGLMAAGSMALNEAWERDRDARMFRTRGRPIPTRKIAAETAVGLGIAAVCAGLILLGATMNLLTAGLGLIVVVLYILVYTPLKSRSPLSTLVGAICGGIPPMMGWAAATGRLDYGALILGTILFVWQIPHFLSLAWLYKDDYARGGFRMLPILDSTGELTSRIAVLYSFALLPLALAAYLAGLGGVIFLIGSVLFGAILLAQGIRLLRSRSNSNARLMFVASLVYMTAVLVLLLSDRGRI